MTALNQRNKLLLVSTASNKRDVDQYMDDANAIKLALLIAKEKEWQDIVIQATKKRVMKKLKRRETNDAKFDNIRKHLHLNSLFYACSLHLVNCNMNVSINKIAKFAQRLRM